MKQDKGSRQEQHWVKVHTQQPAFDTDERSPLEIKTIARRDTESRVVS